MDFTKPRVKKKTKKIRPARILVAYEGALNEKLYFEDLKLKIPRQFSNLISFIPVEKSDNSRSSPAQVLDDLINDCFFEQRLVTKGDDFAFIVIDRDHHFNNTHARESTLALQLCRQKNISVICSTPSFELWRLLHVSDVSVYEIIEKTRMIENRNGYLKGLCNQEGLDNNFDYFPLIPDGILNAEKLNSTCSNNDIPNTNLFTNVGEIFNLLKDLNVDIFRYAT